MIGRSNFNKINLSTQCNIILLHGIELGKHFNLDNSIMFLYAYNSFFVEITYDEDCLNNVSIQINGFDFDYNRIEKYLNSATFA